MPAQQIKFADVREGDVLEVADWGDGHFLVVMAEFHLPLGHPVGARYDRLTVAAIDPLPVIPLDHPHTVVSEKCRVVCYGANGKGFQGCPAPPATVFLVGRMEQVWRLK